MTISIRWAPFLMVLWLALFFLLAIFGGWLVQGLYATVSLVLAVLLWAQPVTFSLSSSSSPLDARWQTLLNRWAMFEVFVLGLAMMVYWWVLRYLTAVGSSDFVDQPLRQQHLEATVGALIIVCSLGLLIMALGALLIIHLDYWALGAPRAGATPGSGNSRLAALTRALRIITGLSQGTIVIDKGKLYTPDGREASLDVCAGPIYLDAREGQVAVIEERGNTSAVVSGRVWLQPTQRVTGHADLTTQFAKFDLENALTRDGVVIDRVELTVGYNVGKGVAPDRPPASDATWSTSGEGYRYRVDAVRRSFWQDTPETYKDSVIAISRNVARSVINSYRLDELRIMLSQARSQLEAELRSAIQLVHDSSLTKITFVVVGDIVLPEKTRQELLDRWVAEMQAGTVRIRADSERDMMIRRARGQAGALRVVEEAKRDARNDIVQMMSLLFPGGWVNDPAYLAAIQSLLAYLSQDSVRALELSDALQQMARNSNQVNLSVRPQM